MVWDLDNPDIPLNKPKVIKQLEAMGKTDRESMPPREMDEKLDEAAEALAKAYQKLPGADYDGCLDVVTVALDVTGTALEGKFGTHMLSQGAAAAERACKFLFKEDEE